MKIDRRRPFHWVLLALFFLQCLAALLARRLGYRPALGLVVLYGHKLNGNLLAVRQAMFAAEAPPMRPVFLTMDRGYARELTASGVAATWACGPGAMALLGAASVLISDHGLHAMQPLRQLFQRTGLRFVDVWHGIPFKGFDAEDFLVQRRYDEVWVASDSQKHLWVQKFGFDPERVRATGYARTDRLVVRDMDDAEARRRLGLDPAMCGTVILFAPTWAQDDKGRSLYPFGCSAEEFLGSLSAFAASRGATVLLRSHMNSGDVAIARYPRVVALPGTRYPDTEAILQASDVLVCDWSSVAFDFLLLQRPTVFLDVPAPFRKGFSLGPEYRFGALVHDLPGLLAQLEICARTPEAYWSAHADAHRSTAREVYGDKADGRSAERCVARLQALIGGMSG